LHRRRNALVLRRRRRRRQHRPVHRFKSRFSLEHLLVAAWKRTRASAAFASNLRDSKSASEAPDCNDVSLTPLPLYRLWSPALALHRRSRPPPLAPATLRTT
jgi:hypothetical protein